MTEIRCIARRSDSRRPWCGSFVTRARTGERLYPVRIVEHSSQADPENAVYACTICGALNEIRVEVMPHRDMENAA